MARILILIGGHLCTAPRPQKEADALAAAGHEVIVAGVWFDETLVQRDRVLLADKAWAFYPALDFRPGQPCRFRVRLQARIVRQLYQWFGFKHPALLGYGAHRLLQLARAISADLTIVHSEAGLWVGQQLLNHGHAVGVDFEDWFSQDLLPAAQSQRPVSWIAKLEADLLKRCRYRLTTSRSMAEALANHHQVAPPTVIYNVFPHMAFTPEASPWGLDNFEHVRLHWFSQTIGPGRGLELLFEALANLKVQVEVHLRGHCSAANQIWLAQKIPLGWASHIQIHPTVSNYELPFRIAENDIGLALEMPSPSSRNLTVTNKLFQYLQAGLAVIATDTVGQREVFQQFPTMGHLVSSGDALALAAAIEDFVCNPAKLQTAKAAASQAAETQFCWDLESQKLVAAAERALHEVPVNPQRKGQPALHLRSTEHLTELSSP